MDMSMSMPSTTAMSMSMSMSTTATAAAAASTSAMSGMDMSMGPGACKISMLWNWYTVDSCFISATWHIRSKSMFAGSCIGVILLTMSLELLRRVSKQYDRYILQQFHRRQASLMFANDDASPGHGVAATAETTPLSPRIDYKGFSQEHVSNTNPIQAAGSSNSTSRLNSILRSESLNGAKSFRPSLLQQMVRASMHAVQFGTAYFIMLLAMYYNGYFIISILIGAWLGGFIFSWETIELRAKKEEVTVCCG